MVHIFTLFYFFSTSCSGLLFLQVGGAENNHESRLLGLSGFLKP